MIGAIYQANPNPSPTPQVPFWLQLMAVILTPTFAFTGVIVGARLAYHSAYKAWLRGERLRHYTEFIQMAYDLTSLRRTISKSSSYAIGEASSNFSRKMPALRSKLATLQVLGPSIVVVQAETVITQLTAAMTEVEATSAAGTNVGGTTLKSPLGTAWDESLDGAETSLVKLHKLLREHLDAK